MPFITVWYSNSDSQYCKKPIPEKFLGAIENVFLTLRFTRI